MADLTPRGVLLSVDDLANSIALFTTVLGMKLDFQDGEHFAQLSKDGFRLSLATPGDHPLPGTTALMVKATSVREAVDALADSGAEVLTPAGEGRDEVRALVRVAGGTPLVVYGPA